MIDDKGLCVLTKEELAFVAEHSAKVAIEEASKERERYVKGEANRRLHDTKKLLRIYRELKAHSDSSIYEMSQIIDEDIFDVLALMTSGRKDPEIEVESIKNSTVRTRIIIEHIDTMLNLYTQRCNRYGRLEECRRDRVIRAMFIDEPPLNAQEIAGIEQVDLRTVYKDVDAACEKLAAYIFGFYIQ